MKATVTGTLLSITPNQQRAGQEASASASMLISGARGPEVKKIKVPLADMMELGKQVGVADLEMEIDVNEYSITDEVTGKQKNGTSYKLWSETKK